MSKDKIEGIFKTADVFIDHMRECEWGIEASDAKLRILVDGEPAFTQIEMEHKAVNSQAIPNYDSYFTVGLNVGTRECSSPTAGKEWHPIFDPVAVRLFPPVGADAEAPFTTVMSWQAHQPIEFDGTTLGQKDVEFQKFISLPGRSSSRLEIAVAGKNVPIQELVKNGWAVRNAHAVTRTFDSWKEYISASRGEFSVCKNIFVATNSGFFSDRSAVYLASGWPVVLQETGFSSHLPCGRGLFAVRTVEESAAAIEQVNGDYQRHSRWAREIAEEYLDTGKVLGRLLEELGIR